MNAYRLVFLVSLVLLCSRAGLANPSPPIEIKVVVAAMFERGEPTGDAPGELQLWIERLELKPVYDFPLGEADLYVNEAGVMAVLLGGGVTNAAASTMALGLDPRFDFSRAYWLIAGIAGGDPDDLSLGSAAWARHVVDGDLLYEIDGREIPEDWPYGMIPLGAKAPAKFPEDPYQGWRLDTIHFKLDPALVFWAYQLTHDVALTDTKAMREYRARYTDSPNARRAPFVTTGDTMSSSTYWHGELLNKWANDWLQLYAGNAANFMTSNMEDSGTLTALHRLGRVGLVDPKRVLVLRTVSNYTRPPAGKSAEWSKSAPYPDQGNPAIEHAFLVGNTVVQAIVQNWSSFRSDGPVNSYQSTRDPVTSDAE